MSAADIFSAWLVSAVAVGFLGGMAADLQEGDWRKATSMVVVSALWPIFFGIGLGSVCLGAWRAIARRFA